MASSVSSRDLLRLRLRSQRIARSTAHGHGDQFTPAEIVRHLLAVQAQDFSQALWAVGVRSPGSTRATVLAALAAGEVVRSAPMRGTLHFVAAKDLRWMLALTSSRTLAGAATRFGGLGLDAATFSRAEEIARETLAGGGALTRDEFLKSLERAGVSTAGQRGYHIIFQLSQRGIVCWGPPAANQQALVLVDDWVAPVPQLERGEALRQFAVRYFNGHGPATERDFSWWSKLTLADAREGIALAGGALIELDLDGNRYWTAAEHADKSDASTSPTSAPARPGLSVLPGFDEYLLGYQDRAHALHPDFANRIVPGNNGIFLPIIVSRGRVIGTWRRSRIRREESIVADPFGELTTGERADLARAGRSYMRFAAG